MEVVEKRPKRSSTEAALPERVLDAGPSPNSILVDAEGTAVTAATPSGDGVKACVPPSNDVDASGGVQSSAEGAPSDDIDNTAREMSKNAFASLVQAACSKRSYPY